MRALRQNKVRRALAVAVLAAASALLSACGGSGLMNDVASAITGNTYTVGGTVSSLKGQGLMLEDNGGDGLAVSGNGTFTFKTALHSGAAYAITVGVQPGNPAQSCSVTNGTGTVGQANVTNVTVACVSPAMTSTGTATGPSVSQSIDPAGGSITSADKRLTVTIPPGALAASTTLTIQPITNQSPGGLSTAYRLGPEGLTFLTPVAISFQYSSADLAGTVPDALMIAFQDAQGYWEAQSSATLDTTHQTLTVQSSHFSDWSMLAGGQLLPAEATVETGQTVTLTFVECQAVQDGLVASLMAACTPEPANVWFVNGLQGGNSSVGTVTWPGGISATGTYTAPGSVPANNPVAVSTTAFLPALLKAAKETFVSNITVEAPCSEASADCTWTGTTTYAGPDSSVSTQATWRATNSNSGALIVQLVSGTATFATSLPNCTLNFSSATITAANLESTDGWDINLNVSPTQYYGGAWLESGLPTETCPDPPGPPASAVWSPANFLNTGPPLSSPSSATLKGSYQDGSGSSWTWDLKRAN